MRSLKVESIHVTSRARNSHTVSKMERLMFRLSWFPFLYSVQEPGHGMMSSTIKADLLHQLT